MSIPLPPGLYDRLVLAGEASTVDELAHAGQAVLVEPSAQLRRDLLLDELSRQLPLLLDAAAGTDASAAEQARRELRLIAALMRQARGDADLLESLPAEPLRVLRAVHSSDRPPAIPVTGARRPWLFTAQRGEPSLLHELRAEFQTADQVDMLVSFITWSGVRRLIDVLEAATALDAAGNPRCRIRILTTTYTGATEERALTELARLPGVAVRVSLDGRRSRLHAKAWLFRRRTGFGTAFVGSANFSGAALLGGIEWTVKFAQRTQADLFEAANAHFESLWADPEFQPYDPEDIGQREALRTALAEQRGGAAADTPGVQTWFELRAKTYQQQMLDELANERRHGRTRNLVVAATGTGKTVVAAFDYARVARERGGLPRLLFVAHRSQILRQSLATFRQVLRRPDFGGLLDGQNDGGGREHVFATIQTLQSRRLVEQMGADYWHMVIVDEAHHVPAVSFDAFMAAIRPALLVGLTATPERADGLSVLRYFDARPDGSPAVSLRLWDALDQQLLAPFEYYATADDVDFGRVNWRQADASSEVGRILTGNDVRARTVIDALDRTLGSRHGLKGIAFCATVEHAVFMAERFGRAGIASVALSGSTPQIERDRAIRQLQEGQLAILCTCDLFNEGVDIPEVNTLLLLRPTQSPVVFQQQIGRGLRLHPGKSSCVVLDFVGLYGDEFRFDTLLRSITGTQRAVLADEVQRGFGRLPPGCSIQFDRVAQQRVLASLRRSLQLNHQRLQRELAAWCGATGQRTPSLAQFCRDAGVEPAEVYRAGHYWTELKRGAGLPVDAPGADERDLGRRLGGLLHADDPTRLAAWRAIASGDSGGLTGRHALMLAYRLLGRSGHPTSAATLDTWLTGHPALRQELGEIADLLADDAPADARPLPEAPVDWALSLHARYTRDEILAAVGRWTADRSPFSTTGVEPLPDVKTELLFVTLDKRGFDEAVCYHDYAISPDRFHWQTQNRAGPNNASGLRYIESDRNGWRFQLFVREDSDQPFVALGPGRLASWEGGKPMSITWALAEPIPAALYRRFSVLRDA